MSGNDSSRVPELLTVKEAARALILSVSTLRRHIFYDRIATYKPGRSVRISTDDLAEFLASCRREKGH